MAQSLAHIALHLVFGVKYRRRVFLTDKMRSDVASYMTGVLNNMGCSVIRAGCVTDHIHILYFQDRTHTVSDVVGTIKRSSSVWIKEQPWAYRNIDFKEFSWQNGYGVFSVSGSRKGVVAEYIDNQMEHHKRQSFQDEYRMFLKKHGLDFDERYVWD